MHNDSFTPAPYLRLLLPHDAGACAEYFLTNTQFHGQYSAEYPEEYYHADQYEDILRQYALLQELGWEFRFGIFISHHDISEELIGIITLSQVEYGGILSARLGYTMKHTMSNRGIMTAQIAQVLDFCRHQLRLHRVEATVLPQNIASKRLLQRHGFHKVGVIPEYMLVQEIWRDMELWSLIL